MMFNVLLMISNYLHDLSVGLLAANILAVYYVGRILDQRPVADQIVPELFRKLSRVTYFALAYILIAGAVRAYFFIDFEWHPAVGRGQVAALIIKHILLVVITVWGLLMHRKYQKKYGPTR